MTAVDAAVGAFEEPAQLRNTTNMLIRIVKLMETWFLADRKALRRFFGPSLNENRFRAWQNLEEVSKDTVLNTLEQATRGCQKPYRKGRISFELLGQIGPQRVSAACPHARELLDFLGGLARVP